MRYYIKNLYLTIQGGVAVAKGKNNQAITGDDNTTTANSGSDYKARAIQAIAGLEIEADAKIKAIQAIINL